MDICKVVFDVPEPMARLADIKSEQFQLKMQKLMALGLIKDDKISFGKAAEMLGISKMALITDLGKMGFAYFDESIEDILLDAQNLQIITEAKQL